MKTNKELEKLTQAFGLLTTLHPTMEIDTSDYMGMAKQIEAHVRDLQARVAELEAERRWIPVSNLPQKEEGECRLSIDVLLQPHPDASTLIAYYDFDDEKWIELQTACDIKVSSQGIWHTLPQLPKDGE